MFYLIYIFLLYNRKVCFLMKEKNIRRIFLFFGVLILSITFIGCSERDVIMDEYSIEIKFEDFYDLNSEVEVTVSIGLNPNYQSNFTYFENNKVVLAYSKDGNLNDENLTILYSITDFFKQEYYFSKNGNKIENKFCEKYVIEKDFFGNKNGSIIFMIYQTTDDSSTYHTSMLTQTFYYKIENEKIFFYSYTEEGLKNWYVGGKIWKTQLNRWLY